MENKTHYISICNQKGGVGKSTFTVLVASLLHYRFGRRVLVADCDYPQWSILISDGGSWRCSTARNTIN